jgi:hypothetical protein
MLKLKTYLRIKGGVNMFIGYYELDRNEPYFNIYYKNASGYRQWHEETFSPYIENMDVLDLSIQGNNYAERKNHAEELAKRCSTYELLRTSDVEKTKKVLESFGISDYEVLGDQNIKITSAVEDSSKIIEKLVKSGIAVYEFAFKQMTLEEYYLNSTGRNV